MVSFAAVFTMGLVLGFLVGLFVYNTIMLALVKKREPESKVIRRLLRMEEKNDTDQ